MNVRIGWVLPLVSARQRPLAHVLLEGGVQGAPEWAEINQVAVPADELLVQDIAPGTWEFRGTAVDVDGVKGPSRSVVAGSIPFDPPGELQEFTATLE